MAQLLESTNTKIPSLRRGQEIAGKVVSVTHGEVLIDVGGKSEGVIGGRELASARDIVSKLSVGDSIDVSVLYPENDAGQVVLSLRKLSGEKRWEDLVNKQNAGEEIEVVALEANRGGIICEWFGLRGFLPASQLLRMPSKLEDLIGKTFSVRVIEADRSTNRLIFSQKTPGKKDLGDLIKLLSKVKIGDKFSGVVTAVLPFGIFVEIEIGSLGSQAIRSLGKNKEPKNLTTQEPKNQKLEGLVHISEISWEKIDDPAQMFKVADKVDVMVIAKDTTSGRLNLSIKQLGVDPFLAASKQYSKDQVIRGKVSRVTAYGVFVELEGGIDGLIHISKIPPNVSWSQGDEIECEIEAVDTASRKISLVPIVTEKPVLYR